RSRGRCERLAITGESGVRTPNSASDKPSTHRVESTLGGVESEPSPPRKHGLSRAELAVLRTASAQRRQRGCSEQTDAADRQTHPRTKAQPPCTRVSASA